MSTYELLTASLASIDVAKWIILPLATFKSAATAVYPSDPKTPLSPLSPLTPFGSCVQVTPFNPLRPCKPDTTRVLITLFCLTSPPA